MMTINTLCTKNSVKVVKEHRVVSRNWDFNVTVVARTIEVILRTSSTTINQVSVNKRAFNSFVYVFFGFTFESFDKDQEKDHKDHL